MSKQVDQNEIRRIAKMWVEIIRLQVSRLEDAVDRFQAAVAHERIRSAIDTAGKSAAQAELARIAPRSLTTQDAATLAADKYFLLLAAAQLAKCVDHLPQDRLPKLQDADLLTHLRNLEEHWEHPGRGSAAWLRNFIPDIQPGRLRHTKDEIWLEGIPVTNLLEWAEDVDRAIPRDTR